MPTPDPHPGVFLRERFLQPLEITPSDLAVALGVEEHRILDLVEGRSPMTADTAGRLALYFDVPARWWLELQARYDAEHLDLGKLRAEVTPYPGLADVLVTPRGVKPLGPRTADPPKTLLATYSEEFLDRLREQAKWAQEIHRTPVQMTLPDGTVVLTGK